MNFRYWILPLVVLTFVLPIYSWVQNTGGFERLFEIHEPPGQSWYVLSRFFGVVALSTGCWQFVIGLSGKFQVSIFTNRKTQAQIHAVLGLLTFSLFWAHALCFVGAVSIRKNLFAYGLLLPNLGDYYHFVISIGWLSLMLVSIAVLVRVLRLKNQMYWHRLVYVVLPLAVCHSALVGSDTRDPLMILNYLVMSMIWLLTLYSAYFHRLSRLGDEPIA